MPTTDDLAADLAAAVRDAEIFAVYQPQISIESGATVAAEALCRWRHPQLGLVAPDTFIRVAEQTGIIHDLGLFMLEECFATAESWRSGGRERQLSVNVSPLQLTDEAFTRHIADEFAERAFAPGTITLEITEGLPVTHATEVIPRLVELRELGVGVSLDDYGTGHALVGQIENLPLTEVKVAGSLIRGVDRETIGPLRDTVELAHDKGLRVVAEGIERLSHLETAVDLGCERAQGYLIGPPRARSGILD